MDIDYHIVVFAYAYRQGITPSFLLCFSHDLCGLPCLFYTVLKTPLHTQVVWKILMLYNDISIINVLS